MKQILYLLVAPATAVGVVVVKSPATGRADGESAPIHGVKRPAGARLVMQSTAEVLANVLMSPRRCENLNFVTGDPDRIKKSNLAVSEAPLSDRLDVTSICRKPPRCSIGEC